MHCSQFVVAVPGAVHSELLVGRRVIGPLLDFGTAGRGYIHYIHNLAARLGGKGVDTAAHNA
ncbi:hypothetical protein D3C73_1535190 [compost metagenome]